jgi:hypothetical protein
MSIEITGPEKFAFQDMVCVFLAIHFSANKAALVIEPINGEDAQLTVEAQSARQVVEVQVKGSSGGIDLNSLAGFLSHFPPKGKENCLLERVLGDHQRIALFVVSGRCNDDALPFVIDSSLPLAPHKKGKVRRKDATALLSAFKSLKVERKSHLTELQRQHRLRLANEISIKAMGQAAERILILERATSSVIRARCMEMLRARRIPADRLDDVLNRLRSNVEQAKQERADVLPQTRETLKLASVPTLRPDGYVIRGAEGEWTKTASRKKVLLLSGPPRCGKSYAARYVAAHFQDLGFELRQGRDVDEAIRFLLEPSTVERVYWLDDPLGGIRLESDATRSWGMIRSLVAKLFPARRLIVSQNREHLLALTNVPKLQHCSLGAHKWFDLGSPSPNFLLSAWKKMAQAPSVPAPVEQKVHALLKSGKGKLEVGNLRHLVSTADQLPLQAQVSAIIRKAQEDAADLGRELVHSNTQMTELLITLALASQPDLPISSTELAFITGPIDGQLPGKIKEFTTYGGKSRPPTYPKYSKEPELKSEMRIALDELESRRFVQHSVGGFEFTHPFYRAAAESILLLPTVNVTFHAIRVLERALFSLGSRTSRAAARTLPWLFELFQNHQAQKEALFKTAVDGLSCIFPTTRDICFSFLMRHQEPSSVFDSRRILGWVELAASIDLDDLEWHDGEAWIPTGNLPLFYGLERSSRRVDLSDVEADLKLLESDDLNILPPAQTAVVVKYLSRHPESVNFRLVLRFLSLDEAFIRSEVVRAWLSVVRENDDELLNRIFADDHPRVALGIYSGLIDGWKNLPNHRRRVLLPYLRKWAGAPLVAAILLPKLSVFDRVEHTGDNPPWSLFAELMDVAISAIPDKLSFDDARFFNAIRCSLPYLDSRKVIRICSAWIRWLQKELQHRLPSDYELGVCDIILQATAKEPFARGSLICELLNFNSTGALIIFVRDTVNSWDDLLQEEKGAILQLLGGTRIDVSWLQAIVLIGQQVPDEVQGVILGRTDRLSADAAVLVAELPPLLLSCMMSVYSGTPQPLWWLGTQAHGRSKVDEIVKVLERDPEHPLFEIVLWRALIGPEDAHIAAIVQTAGERYALRLFDYLLRHKIQCVGYWLPQTWEILLRSIDTRTREQCYDSMAKNAPAILDYLFDVQDWMLNEEDRIAIVRRLPQDLEAENLMLQFKDSAGGNTTSSDPVKRLKELVRRKELRLHGTYSRVEKFLEGHPEANFNQIIKSGRLAALSEGRALKKKMRSAEPVLHHWVGPK